MSVNFLLLTLLATSHHPSTLPNLKRELHQAYKEFEAAQERVIFLEEEIARQEIYRVKRHFEEVSCKNVETEFSEQREVLAHIIQSHPTCAVEAQDVLDQILTYITNRS